MTNLPAKLRDHQSFGICRTDVAEEQVSTDGTIKRAYRCADGQVIDLVAAYTDGRHGVY
jgi:adenine C2-methylase RlmN of 23S rRNA A2503 and tRNA A37